MEKLRFKDKTKKLQGKKGRFTALMPFAYSFLTVAALLFCACIIALLTDVKRQDFYIISLAVLSAGNIASGFITGRMKGEKGLAYAILYSLPVNALLIYASVILNGFKFDYNLLLSLAMLTVCSGAGGVISVNTRRKTKPRLKRSKR